MKTITHTTRSASFILHGLLDLHGSAPVPSLCFVFFSTLLIFLVLLDEVGNVSLDLQTLSRYFYFLTKSISHYKSLPLGEVVPRRLILQPAKVFPSGLLPLSQFRHFILT